MANNTWASQAVAAGTGIAGSLINLRTNRLAREQSVENQNKSIIANRQQSMLDFALQNRQIQKMNEYNAPINQVKRLEDANLNPALMYKGAPQNVQTQMAKYNRPEQNFTTLPKKPLDVAMGMQLYQDTAIKAQQTNNLKAQYDNIRANTANEIIKTGLNSSSLRVKTATEQYQMDFIREQAWKTAHERVNAATTNEILQVKKKQDKLNYAMTLDRQEWSKRGINPNEGQQLKQTVLRYLKKQKVNSVHDLQPEQFRELNLILTASGLSSALGKLVPTIK